MTTRDTILVTGATGYIGGRLVPRLLEADYRVRCLARSPKKVEARQWAGHPDVEIVQGDLADPASINRALEGGGNPMSALLLFPVASALPVALEFLGP